MGLEWLYTSPILLEHRRRSAEARNQANKYAQVENELGAKISELNGLFDTAETYKREKYNTFLNGPGLAEGDILEEFEGAVMRWGSKFDSMMANMKSNLVVLESRRARARELKEHYQAIAEAEESAANV